MKMVFICPVTHLTSHYNERWIRHVHFDRILIVARSLWSTRGRRKGYGQEKSHSAAIFAEARSAASRESSAIVAEARAMGLVR